MEQQLLKEALLQGIESLGFIEDELAFLAASSKIELPFRDKLAFKLFQLLDSDELRVVREWRRVDLAIHRGDKPLLLMELKAMYSFDAVLNNLEKFAVALESDEENCLKYCTSDTTITTALLATHPLCHIPNEEQQVFKYASGVNRGLKKYGDPRSLLDECNALIRDRLVTDRRVLIGHGVTEGGECYSIPINVVWWIFERIH